MNASGRDKRVNHPYQILIEKETQIPEGFESSVDHSESVMDWQGNDANPKELEGLVVTYDVPVE